MKKKIIKKINENTNFIILPHKSPDGDCIGSAIALNEALNLLNKSSFIILEDEIPSNLTFLDIKTYTIKEFEKLNINTNVIITLDSSDKFRFDKRVKYLKDNFIINIDHHKTNTNYGDLNYIKQFSSVGEILYDLFLDMDIDFNKKISNSLYTSISSDTGSFKYSNTSSKTLLIASKLRDKVDFDLINTELYQNQKYEKVILRNKIFETIKIYKEKIGIVYLTQAMRNDLNIKEFNTDGIVEQVRNIEGVSVAIFIKEKEKDLLKVSLRSKYDIDVAKIAFEFNGGGHKKAAGFESDLNIDEIIDKLVDII
ncbi:MAG: DHH family phosphoesterase [Bacillota bacterium]